MRMAASEWQKSLINQGAILSDGALQHFGSASLALTETATNNIVCDLSHMGLLEINGADAVHFLQGQVTNDVILQCVLQSKRSRISTFFSICASRPYSFTNAKSAD
jgi:hypothetical protein